MNIKAAESSRVASYGIALGELLHAAWHALAELFAPGDFDRRKLRGR